MHMDIEQIEFDDVIQFFGNQTLKDKKDLIGEIQTTSLQFCGCGNPNSALEFVQKVLEWYEKKDEIVEAFKDLDELIPDEGTRWFVLYMLDALELTEHGSAVSSGWLTEKGKRNLRLLRELSK